LLIPFIPDANLTTEMKASQFNRHRFLMSVNYNVSSMYRNRASKSDVSSVRR